MNLSQKENHRQRKHVQDFVKDTIETKHKSKVNIIKKSPRLSHQHKDLKP